MIRKSTLWICLAIMTLAAGLCAYLANHHAPREILFYQEAP